MVFERLNIFKHKAPKALQSTSVIEALDKARAVYQHGNYADALAMCQVILDLHPDHIDTLLLTAEIAARKAGSNQALLIYRKVLDLKPDHAVAHYKSGNLMKDGRQFEAAVASYDNAIAYDPGYAYAFCNRGFALEQLKRWDAALDSYDQALQLTPGDAIAHFNRAGVLRELARFEEALAGYAQAIAVKPDYFEAYCNRGLLLAELERWDEALLSHAKSIEINPHFAPAHCGRGSVLQSLKNRQAALASYDRAIEIDPSFAVAHRNRGSLLMELKQWSPARASLDRAISLRPEFPEAYDCLALLLAGLGHLEAALKNSDRAIALKPDYAEGYLNRANLLLSMKRFEAAIADYDRGMALKPGTKFVMGMHRYAKMNCCDWRNLSADLQRLTSGIDAGEMLSPPLPMLALVDSASTHYDAARIWVRDTQPANHELSPISVHARPGKTKVGYFSGDFHEHAVAVLTAGLFEAHDREKFEGFAFSYGPNVKDDMRKRLEMAFTEFIDVREKSDREIALLAREMQIDIAVDLGGHTGISRTGIFAMRAAPLQVNYIGFPGTMGADYMDYIIADPTLVPPNNQRYFAEKILYLPSFQVNDSKRRIADRIFTREELGLPSSGFVFCCFNANYKITPATFAGWMRILTNVPGSVLYLYADNELVKENLRNESRGCGIEPDRLVFAEKLPLPEYLARYRAADLFLDTLPYNAGATASDALWAGLPVLTCLGEAFAGRMGGSLLTAVGLPELVASTQKEYEELAVSLAKNPQSLASIKYKLAANRTTSLLFDTSGFARNLENGYLKILDRFHTGLPPDHVYVQP